MKSLIALILAGITLHGALLGQTRPQFVPGQALVRLKPHAYSGLTRHVGLTGIVETSNHRLNEAFSLLRVTKMERLDATEEFTEVGIRTGMNREFVLYFSRTNDVMEACGTLRARGEIEVAEPNWLFYSCTNDPWYAQQWGLTKIGMPAAWNIQKGNTAINIAVLDAGFKLYHEDCSRLSRFPARIHPAP